MFFFFKQKTAYEVGLGIPAEPLFRSAQEQRNAAQNVYRSVEHDQKTGLTTFGQRSEERFSRNAETDLVCRLLLEKKKRLLGLEASACEQLLAEHELVGSPQERALLVERYEGNPLALNIVAETIVELFGGEIAPFLEQGEVIFGSVRELLAEQFARLSAVEQTVLLWLAIMREPVTIEELLAVLVTPLSGAQVLEAIDGLRRRSLIERGQRPGSLTPQSVVLEYVSAHLVDQASEEIVQGRLALLIQ